MLSFSRKSSDNPYSRRSWCWFNYNYLLWKHVHHVLQCPRGVFLTSWVRSHTLWCHKTPLVWQVISPHSQAQCEGTDHIVFVSYILCKYIIYCTVSYNLKCVYIMRITDVSKCFHCHLFSLWSFMWDFFKNKSRFLFLLLSILLLHDLVKHKVTSFREVLELGL